MPYLCTRVSAESRLAGYWTGWWDARSCGTLTHSLCSLTAGGPQATERALANVGETGAMGSLRGGTDVVTEDCE